jgi:hypothetical protein
LPNLLTLLCWDPKTVQKSAALLKPSLSFAERLDRAGTQ